jgi:AcrR family transcriptional regulator
VYIINTEILAQDMGAKKPDMEIQDRRVRRTHQLLREALVALVLEHGYESISIRQITSRANVGYATFFRHFRDKEALLIDVLELLLAELQELMEPTVAGSDYEQSGRFIFQHVAENSRLYRVLLQSSGAGRALKHIHESSAKAILKRYRPRRGSVVPAEIAANHVVSSMVGLIAWWLENDMPYSAAEMGIVYSELIMGPAVVAAFEEDRSSWPDGRSED